LGSIVVQKYGGSSVATAEHIKAVAQRVKKSRESGLDLAVVVSAMGNTTDRLLALAREVSLAPSPREIDQLLSTGERQSVALLAMALHDRGVAATSLSGPQAGMKIEGRHGSGVISEIQPGRLRSLLAEGQVVIVAGFQGENASGDVTTLGRGGSDTTAVALAQALGADACELYTDVSGVFTADPRLVASARRIPHISFDEMLEMCATGCPKPAMRSVEFARTHGVRLHVRSAFTWEPGTWITEEDPMEQAIISGVVDDDSEAKVTVNGVPDRPGIAAHLFRTLADADINVDMIVQNVSAAGVTDISFTLPREDLAPGTQITSSIAEEIGATGVTTDERIARVSLIGAGMKSNPGVAATMFEVLAGQGVNIEMISTSAIRISCVIPEDDLEKAVNALHDAFELAAT